MQVRVPIAVLVLAVAFAAGLASSRLGVEREARAQQAGAAVYVPPEGLAFRSPDGRLIARLAYDTRGGIFEVYDRRERPSGSLRAGFMADAPARPAMPPGTTTPAPLATTDTPDLGY